MCTSRQMQMLLNSTKLHKMQPANNVVYCKSSGHDFKTAVSLKHCNSLLIYGPRGLKAYTRLCYSNRHTMNGVFQ